MFREMRRKQQQLSAEDCTRILLSGSSGVLAVWGDDSYPYAVPLSYVCHEHKIFFHCAKTGHKLDAILAHPKVSFCVIEQDLVLPAQYTTLYRSVIAFGTARILEDEHEKRAALALIAAKYTPDDPQGRLQEVERSLARVAMVELCIEHLTGKEAIELTAQMGQPSS